MKNIIFALILILGSISFSQSQTIIKGKLVGYDSKPIIKAHAHIKETPDDMMYKSAETVETKQDGSFELKTDRTGVVVIMFTGVNHQLFETALYIEKPRVIELDVKLSTYDYLDDIDDVKIIGDFNDFDFQKAIPMEKQSDGTFTNEFRTDKQRFAYQLLQITKEERSVNGTQADDYEYDGGGDYRSVVFNKDSLVTIKFDPKKLIKSAVRAEIKFIKTDILLSKFSELYLERKQRFKNYQEAAINHMQAGKQIHDFKYDFSADIELLKSKLSHEKETILRHTLLLNTIEMSGLQQVIDTNLVKVCLEEISPTSPIWSLYPNILPGIVFVSGDMKNKEYLIKTVKNHSDDNVKAIVLFNLIGLEMELGDRETAKNYYELLMKDFSNHPYAVYAKDRFNPDKKIIQGSIVPEFSIPSIEDSTIIYTNESFKGKYLLIDFWAVWCKPCIAEMEHLHEAYDKFKDKNFEILSISFDAKPEDVFKFREGKWKMPWHHSFAKGGFESDIGRIFEVDGIPKPILVDPTGKIIAIEGKLRGKQLVKTIAELINK